MLSENHLYQFFNYLTQPFYHPQATAERSRGKSEANSCLWSNALLSCLPHAGRSGCPLQDLLGINLATKKPQWAQSIFHKEVSVTAKSRLLPANTPTPRHMLSCRFHFAGVASQPCRTSRRRGEICISSLTVHGRCLPGLHSFLTRPVDRALTSFLTW